MKAEASTSGSLVVPPRSRGISGWLTVVVMLTLLAAAAYVGYTRLHQTPTPPAKLQTAAVTKGTVAASVTATGSVDSLTTSRLGFKSVGNGTAIVSQVLVSVGDQVKKGQVLAKL